MAHAHLNISGRNENREQPQRRRVAITGAAGRIGLYLAEHSHAAYDLVLLIKGDEDVSKISGYGEVVCADLGDLDRLTETFAGVDAVVHLAGDPDPKAGWDSLLANNIVGTYNAMAAAKASGCRRFIYASSIHAVSGYARDIQVKSKDPVNPGDLYGVSKCFGEALGRFMAEQEGLSVIEIRIGTFMSLEGANNPKNVPLLDAFVSKRDLTQLIHLCIDDRTLHFAVVNGVSNNRFKRLDISDARELLGYRPQDDLAKRNAALEHVDLEQDVMTGDLPAEA